MARVALHAGAEIDLVTPKELGEGLDELRGHIDDVWRERAKGAKFTRRRFTPPAGTTTSAVLEGIGPRPGYVWVLKMVLCVLSASDTLTVYDDGAGAFAPIAPVSAASVTPGVTWSSDQVLINADDKLFIATGGTGNIVKVRVHAVEIIAEREGIYLQ